MSKCHVNFVQMFYKNTWSKLKTKKWITKTSGTIDLVLAKFELPFLDVDGQSFLFIKGQD